jgi:signal transduction histidine kinase/ligand-binding sensor domain-containing protein
VAAVAYLCFISTAHAVDPNRLLSQYVHDRWSTDKGFTGATVSSFAQTTDGYLWIGTDQGLFRFDGLTFHLFQEASPTAFPIGAVQGLMADAQGNLWILLQSTKILRYHDGKFEFGNEEAEFGITSVSTGADGTILFSSLALGELTYRGGKFETLNAPDNATKPPAPGSENTDDLTTRRSWATGLVPHRFAEPNSAVLAMMEMPDGKIFLGTREKGLFYLKDGRVIAAPKSPPNARINCLLALDSRNLLIGTDSGLLLWNGTEVTTQGVPQKLRHTSALAMIRDRDSNLWLGTPDGLTRIHMDGPAVLIDEDQSRSNTPVTALFEDREGNLWLGGPSGIERVRDSTFLTYSPVVLQSESTGPVYADKAEEVWFAPLESGLRHLTRGKSEAVINDGLAQDVVYSIAGDQIGTANELWLGRQHGGLTQLHLADGHLVAKTYTQSDGLAQNSVYAVYASNDGAVWAGTLSGGVSEFRNGRFKTYTTADGLASNTITAMARFPDGTMWFATPNGISSLSKGHWQSFKSTDGLPSASVNCLLAEANGTLWIGTAAGLAALREGHIFVPAHMPASLYQQILGIAEDQTGWLWISTSNNVLRVKRDRLLAGPLADDDVHMYTLQDGLQGTEGVKRFQSVFTDPSGKIWFSMNHGLSVVDPARAASSSASAIVHINTFSADGKPISTTKNPVRVSGSHQRVTFNYAALSLSVPERVRYKYKLDNLDESWSDPVTTGEVTYNHLAPGSYRFRVMASNSDGLWNSSESVIPFEIAPAYWQTWWFRLASVAVAILALLLFIRLRMLGITRQMNMRFEERLAERTRIAQELHDTLLQGFVSASMQLHVADDHLAVESPAKPFVGRVLHLMGRVIEEGRNAVRGIRLPDAQSANLEQAFSALQQELQIPRGTAFRVFAEGEALPLRPVIRESVYRIGREALINSLRHSHATKIEVELVYAPKYLRLLVRDNGTGIDQEVLRAGREGHWGLSGMRERAEEIGAKLRVLSSPAAGTEIDLTVPARIAFEPRISASRFHWLAKLKPAIMREPPSKPESAGKSKSEVAND